MLNIIFQYIQTEPVFCIILLFAFILAVYFAIVPHEVAHGLVAKWNGDYTAEQAGRITMNPVVHVDVIGLVMLLLVGFGYAKPVPVNPYNFRNPRRGMFLVAIAGIVYNIVAAFVCFFFLVFMTFLLQFDFYDLSTAWAYYLHSFFYFFFYFCGSINVTLFLFNVLPLGPLDGFKIISAYAGPGNRFIRFLANYGTYILIALFILNIVASRLSDYSPIAGYVDVLGMYLSTCSYWISHAFTWLFQFLFGMNPVW